MIAILIPILMVLGPELTVDEAFQILERRAVSGRDYRLACEAVENGCAHGDEACVRRLLEIWSDKWSQHVSMELACKKADDKTLPLILDAVRAAMKHQDDKRVQGRVTAFFFRPAQLLCERLANPEPVLQFAVDNTRPFGSYPVDPALKDKYALEALRRATQDTGGDQVPAPVSEDAMVELRALLREMYPKYPRSAGVWAAIRMLVEWCDAEIVPDLEAILASPPFPQPEWKMEEGNLRMYIAKLRFQGHPDEKAELLRIVRSEREHGRLLGYATWRLLYLKMDRQTILEALVESNSQTNSEGRDVTAGLRLQLGPDRLPPVGTKARAAELLKRPRVNEYSLNTLIFDRQQRAAYLRDGDAMHAASKALTAEEDAIRREGRRAMEEAGDDSEKQKQRWDEWRQENPDKVKRLAEIAEARKKLHRDYMYKYSLKAILEAAPLGPGTDAGP
ncbi:MAG: hypothetical protein KAY37_04705 [Phycisphaerae bacterium]|nr:hypothetical protein [Phycisphaerae bacterium]